MTDEVELPEIYEGEADFPEHLYELNPDAVRLTGRDDGVCASQLDIYYDGDMTYVSPSGEYQNAMPYSFQGRIDPDLVVAEYRAMMREEEPDFEFDESVEQPVVVPPSPAGIEAAKRKVAAQDQLWDELRGKLANHPTKSRAELKIGDEVVFFDYSDSLTEMKVTKIEPWGSTKLVWGVMPDGKDMNHMYKEDDPVHLK